MSTEWRKKWDVEGILLGDHDDREQPRAGRRAARDGRPPGISRDMLRHLVLASPFKVMLEPRSADHARTTGICRDPGSRGHARASNSSPPFAPRRPVARSTSSFPALPPTTASSHGCGLTGKRGLVSAACRPGVLTDLEIRRRIADHAASDHRRWWCSTLKRLKPSSVEAANRPRMAVGRAAAWFARTGRLPRLAILIAPDPRHRRSGCKIPDRVPQSQTSCGHPHAEF